MFRVCLNRSVWSLQQLMTAEMHPAVYSWVAVNDSWVTGISESWDKEGCSNKKGIL